MSEHPSEGNRSVATPRLGNNEPVVFYTLEKFNFLIDGSLAKLNANQISITSPEEGVFIIRALDENLFINSLCHPDWDSINVEHVGQLVLEGFMYLKNETEIWGDPYCIDWFTRKFKNKFSSTGERCMMVKTKDDGATYVVECGDCAKGMNCFA